MYIYIYIDRYTYVFVYVFSYGVHIGSHGALAPVDGSVGGGNRCSTFWRYLSLCLSLSLSLSLSLPLSLSLSLSLLWAHNTLTFSGLVYNWWTPWLSYVGV